MIMLFERAFMIKNMHFMGHFVEFSPALLALFASVLLAPCLVELAASLQ